MVSLGIANSRMKDFYDAWVLLEQFELDEAVLGSAIRATFERRRTSIPSALPLALTDEFAANPNKQRQWTAFLRQSGQPAKHKLRDVVNALRGRLMPLLPRHSWCPNWRHSRVSRSQQSGHAFGF